MKSISKEKQLEQLVKQLVKACGKKHISSLKTATIKSPDDFINYFNDFSLFTST